MGFHVAGIIDPLDGNSPAAKANISSWGGLCVTYASESDLDVVLAYAQNDGFGNLSRMPKVTLPKSIELRTVCADWDNFMTVFSEVSTTFMTSILFAASLSNNMKPVAIAAGVHWTFVLLCHPGLVFLICHPGLVPGSPFCHPGLVLFDHLELQLLCGHDPRMGTGRNPFFVILSEAKDPVKSCR